MFESDVTHVCFPASNGQKGSAELVNGVVPSRRWANIWIIYEQLIDVDMRHNN